MLKKLGNSLERLGSKQSTSQLQRIVILSGVLLVLMAVSFGVYYYYDRYYQPQDSIVTEKIKQAEDAVRADPENVSARVNLANIYLTTKSFQKAIDTAAPLIAREPDNPDLLMILGIGYVLNDQPESGIPFLEKFVGFFTDDQQAAFNKAYLSASYYLGDAYLMTNEPDKAVYILEHLYSLDSSDADAMYKLGIAYTQIGDTARAKVVLHQATLFVPDFKEVYEQLAIVFAQTGETALKDYADGMVAYCDKDYDNALALLKRSAETEPNSAPTYNGLGMVYEATNQLIAARESYDRALQADPNYISAQNGFTRVENLLK